MKSVHALAVALAALVFLGGGRAFGQTLEEGLQYLENEQYTRAESVFTALTSSSPSATNTYYLGNYYLAVGQVDAAQQAFERGLAMDDKSALIQVGLGEVEIAKGNPAGAEDYFKRAERYSRKRDADVYYHIGQAYLRHESKNTAAAIDALKKATEMESGNAAYFVALGDAYRAARDGGKAAASYEQALYIDPSLAKAHVRIGDLYVDAKTYSAALAKYNEAVAADSTYLPAYRSLGEIYFLAKQYDKAAQSYGKYVAQADPNPDARFTYAGYLYLNNQYAASLAELQKLGQDYPNPVLYRLLAYNDYETEQYDQGLEHIQTFFQRADTTRILASDYEYLGRLQLEGAQDTLAGIASLRRAIEADSSKWGLHRDIAFYYLTGGKYAEAAQEYAAMAARGMDLSATDYLNQGKAYYYSDQYGKADTAFARINEVAPSAALGWLWRARANAKLDPESTEGLAKPYYEKFIELTTDPAKSKGELIEANYYLAYYYYVQNDPANAQKYVDAVLALEPTHENAQTLAAAIGSAGEGS